MVWQGNAKEYFLILVIKKGNLITQGANKNAKHKWARKQAICNRKNIWIVQGLRGTINLGLFWVMQKMQGVIEYFRHILSNAGNVRGN